jgi:hypothetical protein
MSQLGLGLGLTKGGVIPFNPLSLDPYLLFDTQSSMIGTFENPTLDLDPSKPDTLNVITATRAGVATYTDAAGLIQLADPNTVRVDHVDGVPMILVEPAATNFWTNNRTFSGGGITVTNNATTAPDGTETAQRLVVPDGANSRSVSISLNKTAAVKTYTSSVYFKSSGFDSILFRITAGAQVFGRFLRLDGSDAAYAAAPNAYGIEEFGGGWFRGWVNYTTDASTNLQNQIYPADSVNGVNGNGVDGIYLWGAMIEEAAVGAGPTSLILTAGSPVTRAADDLQIERDSTNLVEYSSPTLAQASASNLTEDSGTYYGFSNWLQYGPASSGHAFLTFSEIGTVTGEHTLSFYIIMDDGGVPVVGTSSTGATTDFSVMLEGSSFSGLSGVVTHVIGDMYRVTGVRTCLGSSTAHQILKYGTQSERGFKITGIQFESGELTSYIPTSGAAASRTTFSDFYNQSEGTVYVESTGRGYFDFNTLFAFSDNSPSNRIYARSSSVADGLVVFSGGSNVAIIGGFTAKENNVLSRDASSFKTNNFLSSRDGTLGVPDTNGNMPVGINRLYIGAGETGGNQLNGHIKRLIYWPYHSDSL